MIPSKIRWKKTEEILAQSCKKIYIPQKNNTISFPRTNYLDYDEYAPEEEEDQQRQSVFSHESLQEQITSIRSEPANSKFINLLKGVQEQDMLKATVSAQDLAIKELSLKIHESEQKYTDAVSKTMDQRIENKQLHNKKETLQTELEILAKRLQISELEKQQALEMQDSISPNEIEQKYIAKLQEFSQKVEKSHQQSQLHEKEQVEHIEQLEKINELHELKGQELQKLIEMSTLKATEEAKKFDDLNTQVQPLIETMRDQILMERDKVEKLTELVKKVHKENETLFAAQNDMEAVNGNVMQQLQLFQEKNVLLEQKLNLTEQTQEIQLIEQLKQALAEKDEELKKYKSQKGQPQLSPTKDQLERLQIENAFQLDVIQKTNKDNTEFFEEKQRLAEQLSDLKQAHEKQRISMKEQKTDAKTVERELGESQGKVEELTQKLADSIARVEELEQGRTNDSSDGEQEKIEEQLLKIKEETINMYEERLQKMKEQNGKCMDKIGGLMDDNTKLMDRLRNALQLNMAKNIKEDKDESRIDELEETVKVAKEVIEKLKQTQKNEVDFEKIIQQDDQLISDIASKQIEIDVLNEQVENFETSLLSIQSHNDENIHKIETKYNRLIQRKNAEIRELEKEKLEEEGKHGEEIQKLEYVIQNLVSETKNVESEIQKMFEAQTHQKRSVSSQKTEEQEEEISRLQNETDQLQDEMILMEDANQSILKDLQSQTNDLNLLKKTVVQQDKSLLSKEVNIKSLNEEIGMRQKDFLQLKQDLYTKVDRIESDEVEIQKLRSIIIMLDEKLQTAGEKEEIEEKIDQMKEEVEEKLKLAHGKITQLKQMNHLLEKRLLQQMGQEK